MILSRRHLDLMEDQSNNDVIKNVTLCLTLIGCLSQLYHHTIDYVDKDVLRELNKVPVDTFDLPDQTLCFQFVYLIKLDQIRKVKPVILSQVENFFKIKLNDALYFKLIRENSSFKEYFIRKVDEHVNFEEFHQILYKKSQIFDRIEVQFNDKIGHLEIFQINQHCVIKKLVKTFHVCYTFSCSKNALNNEYNNRTFIKDSELEDYELDENKFSRYTMQQRYLLSYLGKNIAFKIHLNKKLFIKNGLKNFFIQIHESNRYPRNLESLTYVQEINKDGFRQLYTFTFLHVKRLEAPYKSNCTRRKELRTRRVCENDNSERSFNSLLFGNYYSSNPKYNNLSLGLNLQYFYYKYNKKILEKVTTDCSIKTSLEMCDEYIYYIYSNFALPCGGMILQLMIPINANYFCEDRPKLSLSEYLLKSLSIINFWFGFTIVQMLFNLHDDIGILYKRAILIDYEKKKQEEKQLVKKEIDLPTNNNSINTKDKEDIFKPIVKTKNGLDFINRIFKPKKESDLNTKLELNSYLAAQNRALLYRNLQLNDWLYNPLTYLDSKLIDDDLIFKKLNRNSKNKDNKLEEDGMNRYNSPTNNNNNENNNKIIFKNEKEEEKNTENHSTDQSNSSLELSNNNNNDDDLQNTNNTNNTNNNTSSNSPNYQFNKSENKSFNPISKWSFIRNHFLRKRRSRRDRFKDSNCIIYNSPIIKSNLVNEM